MHEGNDLIGKPLYAIDQELGTVADFYFDDRSWKIRYFLIAPQNPANPENVLVSPNSLASFASERLSIQLTEREIFNNPSAAQEEKPPDHSPYDHLLGSAETGGLGAYPVVSSVSALNQPGTSGKHLRSYLAVLKYSMYSNEAPSAKIKGVLFDEPLWQLRAIIFSIRDKSDPQSRLIDPAFIDSVDPALEAVYVGCSGVFLRQSPYFSQKKYINISYKDFLQLYSEAIRQ